MATRNGHQEPNQHLLLNAILAQTVLPNYLHLTTYFLPTLPSTYYLDLSDT